MPAKPRTTKAAQDDETAPTDAPAAAPAVEATEPETAPWTATQDLTVHRHNGRLLHPPLQFAANQPCLNAPDGWPPPRVIEAGLVRPTTTEGEGA